MFTLGDLAAVESATSAWRPLRWVLDLGEDDAAAAASGLDFRALGVVPIHTGRSIHLRILIHGHQVLVSGDVLLRVDEGERRVGACVRARSVLHARHDAACVRLRLHLKAMTKLDTKMTLRTTYHRARHVRFIRHVIIIEN